MLKKILLCTLLLNAAFLHCVDTPPLDVHLHIPPVKMPEVPSFHITLPPALLTNTIGACSIGLTTLNACAYLSKKLHCRNGENIELSGHRATTSLAAALATIGLSLSLSYDDSGWKINLGALTCAAAAFAGLEWWEKKK